MQLANSMKTRREGRIVMPKLWRSTKHSGAQQQLEGVLKDIRKQQFIMKEKVKN